MKFYRLFVSREMNHGASLSIFQLSDSFVKINRSCSLLGRPCQNSIW